MGAALLPLAIGGAGIAGGQYMKRQEADAQKAALPQLLHQASLASRPQTLALQAFGPTRADMAQTAMRAGQPEMALKLSGLDRILGPGQQDDIVEVNGQLVNKRTGKLVGDYRTNEPAKPQSDIARINADFSAGLITAQQRDAALSKLTAPAERPVRAPNAVTLNNGQQSVVFDINTPEGFSNYQAAITNGWQSGEIKKPTQADQRSAENAYRQAETGLDSLAKAVVDLKTSSGLPRITGMMSKLPTRPGSDAANAEAQLNTIKSKTAFSALQAMRDASKTGGALGSITERELDLLQNNIAALDTSQSTEAFNQQLDQVLEYVNSLKDNMSKGYSGTFGKSLEQSVTPMSASATRIQRRMPTSQRGVTPSNAPDLAKMSNDELMKALLGQK